jgi:hypothetical protein
MTEIVTPNRAQILHSKPGMDCATGLEGCRLHHAVRFRTRKGIPRTSGHEATGGARGETRGARAENEEGGGRIMGAGGRMMGLHCTLARLPRIPACAITSRPVTITTLQPAPRLIRSHCGSLVTQCVRLMTPQPPIATMHPHYPTALRGLFEGGPGPGGGGRAARGEGGGGGNRSSGKRGIAPHQIFCKIFQPSGTALPRSLPPLWPADGVWG